MSCRLKHTVTMYDGIRESGHIKRIDESWILFHSLKYDDRLYL